MLIHGWHAEISPVCAIVGGILAQELIKVVTGKDEPLSNFFFYNGMDGGGFVECVPAPPAAAATQATVVTMS